MKFLPVIAVNPLLRRSFSISIAFLLFTGMAVPAGNGMKEDILRYTNQFRQSKGLKELIMVKDLNEIARKHSEDMAKGRTGFGHGGYKQRVLQAEKVIHPFYGMAENVAYGAESGKEAFLLWKNSSGHRKNMLGNYKFTGIGIAKNNRGTFFFTQVFVK